MGSSPDMAYIPLVSCNHMLAGLVRHRVTVFVLVEHWLVSCQLGAPQMWTR